VSPDEIWNERMGIELITDTEQRLIDLRLSLQPKELARMTRLLCS
jgi:hypothetical protein